MIHIPRVAGTSIETLIGGQGHKTVLYFKRFVIGQSDLKWDKIFKFAFVRNPYDKFISSYKWAVNNYDDWKKMDINDLAKDIREKYKTWEETDLKALMFKGQHRFICNQYYTPQVDFIGKFENLKDDWAYVAKKLGIKGKLPHLNKSKGKPKLTSQSKRLIAEIYEKDFETFEYKVV